MANKMLGTGMVEQQLNILVNTHDIAVAAGNGLSLTEKLLKVAHQVQDHNGIRIGLLRVKCSARAVRLNDDGIEI